MRFKWTGNDSEFLTHGKVYEFREHDKTQHVLRDDRGLWDHYWDIDTMTEDGWELVKDEGPVRTVTHREIVPGVYGRVYMVRDQFGELRYSFRNNAGEIDTHVMLTAEELREAAHILNQIAEALEDA